VEKIRVGEGSWSPAEGSYEEAVLSWQEQIEASFRRREFGPQKASQEPRSKDAVGGRAAMSAAS
jgi:hypothetical protein